MPASIFPVAYYPHHLQPRRRRSVLKSYLEQLTLCVVQSDKSLRCKGLGRYNARTVRKPLKYGVWIKERILFV